MGYTYGITLTETKLSPYFQKLLLKGINERWTTLATKIPIATTVSIDVGRKLI